MGKLTKKLSESILDKFSKMCIRDSRETVASDNSRRWASCPMEENRKVSVLVLI